MKKKTIDNIILNIYYIAVDKLIINHVSINCAQ